MKLFSLRLLILLSGSMIVAQQAVRISRQGNNSTINVYVDEKLFTQFLFPDTLEKPVLFPIYTSNGTMITRGFPLKPLPGEPTDHPHHVGLWLNFEKVNGLDFWNNSYAIPPDKKSGYGWIKTDRIITMKSGGKGILTYHANWANQKNKVLLEEITRFEFSGTAHQRIIDRTTTLIADTTVLFADAKDGMLGLRVTQALQIPSQADQKFSDSRGHVTVVKANENAIANGNYITSTGKMGDSVWSTRAVWCKMFGKIGTDSVSVTMIDHPGNPNYPTFWHARGYGLFAANPLGEKIFTNGASQKNLHLEKGESVTFHYRIVITNGKTTPSSRMLNEMANEFAKTKPD